MTATTGTPAPEVTSASPAPIEVEGVSRWYRDVVALTRVSFRVGAGVTGLLGPNGAGKTSLIRILVGLHPASEGRVRVDGRDPRRDPEVHRRLGHVPEAEAVPEAVSARRFVRVLAVQHGLAAPDAAAAHALDRVGLDPDDRRPLATYSKGMRQRAKVAAALVHDPATLVLDEPLNGLDPTGRVAIMDLLRGLGAEGRCVLVSSHVLHEVERLADRVLVLVQGRLAAEGPHRAIRDLMDDRPRRLRVRTDAPRALGAALLSAGVAGRVEVGDGWLLVDTGEPVAFRDGVARIARDVGARLLEVTPLDEDLDSVFTYLVERRR
jgi:ABC-2 type transport system ATP-binding protein